MITENHCRVSFNCDLTICMSMYSHTIYTTVIIKCYYRDNTTVKNISTAPEAVPEFSVKFTAEFPSKVM